MHLCPVKLTNNYLWSYQSMQQDKPFILESLVSSQHEQSETMEGG